MFLNTQWKRLTKIFLNPTLIPLLLCFLLITPIWADTDLPIKEPVSGGYKQLPFYSIDCLLSDQVLQACILDGDEQGLRLDLSSIHSLLDGTDLKKDETLGGTVYLGAYPFESTEVDYTYKRFRHEVTIVNGKAILPVGLFLMGYTNSEDWTDTGQLVVRFNLVLKSKDAIQNLGLIDTFIRFKKITAADNTIKYIKRVTVTEGPFVNLITSDDPTRMVISFSTDQPVPGKIVLNDGRSFGSDTGTRHEITVSGLVPDSPYRYHLELQGDIFPDYSFRTAPNPGQGEVTFAYCGDARAGVGGGTFNLMGVNSVTLERIANLAYHKDAAFFIFGGDLISGYTTNPDDFRTQMHGWKQTMAGFLNHRPVYSCIGNHEALLNVYQDKVGTTLAMDRWPYDRESAEAIFAEQLVQPQNGPTPTDTRRPTYKENVYSFQYGPVQFIVFNNNYWVARNLTSRESAWRTGGSPEGYIMDDQMAWIEQELKKAESNPTVKYIILFAQEPVFPNGGHLVDAMWYTGNNAMRAYTLDKTTGKILPEQYGMIEVRNHLVTLIGQNPKVAAVLGSDEHAYHKILINKDVPVGVPALDAAEGSSLVCQENGSCSSIKELSYATWYLVCGGGGAPYYAEESTPWNRYWKNFTGTAPEHTSMRGCFYYSSQENVFIFTTTPDTISLTVYNPYGEVIDKVDDLMKVKTSSTQRE